MRYFFATVLVGLTAGAVSAGEVSEVSSSYQAQTPQADAFDMEAAEDRWVKIGSWFFMFLIVVVLVKRSIDKRKKPAPRATPARRPPARR